MATIQGLYIALFGRPADPRGLAFFNAATAGGANLVAIGPLEASAEFQSRFAGQTNSAIINAIYQSLFNRDADLPGLNFFLNALAAGPLTISALAARIIDGARGDDLAVLNNKLAAANAFTAAVDTAAEVAGYAGSTSTAIARSFLTGVTTSIPTAAQIDEAVARAAGLFVIIDPGPADSTVLLTTGTDDFKGTSAVETYVATAATVNPTFNATDSVNGGGGTDILNLTITAGFGLGSVPAASFTSVENIFVRNLSGNSQSINGNNFVGHQQLWSDRSTTSLDFTNVAAGATIGLKGDGSTILAPVTGTYVNAATTATLAIAGGVQQNAATDVVINGTGLTAVTITSTGAANEIDDVILAGTVTAVTINATTNLTIGASSGGAGLAGIGPGATLTISGAASSVVLADRLDARFKSVDASGLTTGGASIILDADPDTTFKGGQGNDTVTTGAVLTTGSADAGAGTGDRLIVTNSSHLANATLGAKYTNFEQLQVNDGVTVDLDNIAGINAIRINDAAGSTGVTNLTAAQAAAITVVSANGISGPITIGVKGATTNGQIDTVKITVDDGQTAQNLQNLGTPTLAGVEKLSITANDPVIIESLIGAPVLDTLTITGGGNVEVTTGANSVVNFKIDASGSSGALNLDASAYATNGVEIVTGSGSALTRGSAQADLITIGSGGASVVNGGGGADVINLTAAVDKVDVVSVIPGESSSTAFDKITGFTNTATVGDKLLLGAFPNIVGSNSAAGTGTGIANLTLFANAGIVGFAGALASSATLTQKIQAVAFLAETKGESYAFEHGGNTYIFQNADVTAANGALSATDTVVELTGVTGITALSTAASAASTIWIG